MLLRAALVRSSLIALFFAANVAGAQEDHSGHDMTTDSAGGPIVMAGASGILLGTIASPGVNNRTLAEGYLTQPLVMGMLMTRGGRFVADLTLDFEGTTLKRGELNAGVHGEGYIDRRHPHRTAAGLTRSRNAARHAPCAVAHTGRHRTDAECRTGLS